EGRSDREPRSKPRVHDGHGRSTPGVLLLTELFPPAVGGSPMLFGSIYSQLRDFKVTVLTRDGVRGTAAATRDDDLTIVRRPMATRHWGLLDPQGLVSHLRVARHARALGSRGRVVVHCGRALPEGVAAWLSHRLGGPSYVCWAHGEDIAT